MCCTCSNSRTKLARGGSSFSLKGVYDLDATAQSVHACLEVMATRRQDEFPQEPRFPVTLLFVAARSLEALLAAALEGHMANNGKPTELRW